MSRFVATGGLVVAVLLWAGPAVQADVVEKIPKEGVKALNANDFVIKAIESGHAEVKFSQLAKIKATDAKVKEFATMMVNDHEAANKKLLEQARGLKVGVVVGLNPDKRRLFMDLGKRSGADFDREYVRIMVEDHEKAVRMFESYSKSGAHEDLRTFAKDTLPHLKKHLKEARGLAARLKKGT